MDETLAVAESGFVAEDHGWKKVVYQKRQRKNPSSKSESASDLGRLGQNGGFGGKSDVFRSVEEQAEERRRRIVEAQKKAEEAAAAEEDEAVLRRRQRRRSEDEMDGSDGDGGGEVSGSGAENGAAEAKKLKEKKPKKPRVTVPEAAMRIDSPDLAAFLLDISGSYESQEDIQLMRFADYFARAFSSVTAAQFPWTKMFKEFPVAKIAEIPVCYLPEPVYKTSVDWISKRSSESLGSFVVWLLDGILADLANQQASAKGSKKATQHAPSKAQVAIFLVLAMVLRRKPDVLIPLLPALRENSKYHGQDKLPIIIWTIAQASQGDLGVGMYAWSHSLLPMISGKSSNPHSRDMILQLVERILSAPKARTILLNGAVRKGERLVPPNALELLLHITFPTPSAQVKATERFQAVYPTLKELSLVGSPGSKAMKQVTQQIFGFAIKAAGENISELSKEASGICIWCLTQNPDCLKQWENLYLDNLEASVAVLRKLYAEWNELSVNRASFESVREALKVLRLKNEKELKNVENADRQSSIRAADKYCKLLLGRLSHSNICMKSMVFAVVAAAVGAYVMYPNMELLEWKKISAVLNF
ncbi:hypothetical protein Syun_022047 [Stephania yunnanensis]|uniref:Transmembrane protein 214-A n=1 Tax=Stephania yunnanensis TaxID=152371 RepID=A0AAP0IH75_9MAGN